MVAPRPANLVITNSNTFLGRRLVGALSEDFHVIGLDAVKSRQAHVQWTWLKCDLTDDDDIDKVLDPISYQGVAQAFIDRLIASAKS